MRPFYVGLLSERLRANASFKPTQLKRSLMCMTANLIFLTTFLIKQKSSRHAAESGITIILLNHDKRTNVKHLPFLFLMSKVPHTRKHHRNATLIGRCDDFIITH